MTKSPVPKPDGRSRYYSPTDGLTGKRVQEVYFGEDLLTFVTDDGPVTYRVEGDCCSVSYFNDFVGLDKLRGRIVKEFNEIDLTEEEIAAKQAIYGRNDDDVEHYGYELVTEDPKWGEQTTVFSFRNESNGYYGGMMIGPLKDTGFDLTRQRLLTEDVVAS